MPSWSAHFYWTGPPPPNSSTGPELRGPPSELADAADAQAVLVHGVLVGPFSAGERSKLASHGYNKRQAEEGQPTSLPRSGGPKEALEITPCRARISPKPTDYTNLLRLSVKYALFALWQSSEDPDRSARVTSA